jgi:hypothetical protein
VNRTKLWIQMFKMGVRPALIISLMNYYKNFQFIVNKDNEYSTLICTNVGVKQGGNISPDLYKLYTEPIATKIDEAGLGIKLGKIIINVLMYADDVILLAKTIDEAQQMLDIVTDFGNEYQIKYNPSKTCVMIETNNKKLKQSKLLLCDKEITLSEQIKYLGSEICSNGKSRTHIISRKSKSIKSLNWLRNAGILNNDLNIKNKIMLYNIYIKSIMYYGLESTMLNKGDIDLIEKAEGNNIKQVIGIPNQCRSLPIYGALKIMRPLESYKYNQYKFLIRALDNDYLKRFFHEVMYTSTKGTIIGSIKTNLGLKNNASVDTIKEKLLNEILDIKVRVQDRYKYNNESQTVAKIFETNSYELRKLRLLRQLYYANSK